MTYVKNLCIACIAEFLKLACPWYFAKLLGEIFNCVALALIFLLTLAAGLLLPMLWESQMDHHSFSGKLDEPVIPLSQPLDVPFFPEPAYYDFPIPEGITYHIKLWEQIFSRYSSREVLIYDSKYPQIIYGAVNLDASESVSAAMRTYKNLLLQLENKTAHNALDTLNAEEQRIYNMFQDISEPHKFRHAAYRQMRSQRGQRNYIMKAIRTSGLYQSHFERIFRQHGIPVELTRIPFVESHFNCKAYSSAGAAGVWQFMPATARLYDLQVSSRIDERYDPFKSADSAARLLKANYELLGSWPLAITAYNHGTQGMLNAVKQLGTTDLGEIVKNYRGARFGFYSKNYYAQFVAIVYVMRQCEEHFGQIDRLPALQYEHVTLDKSLYVKEILATTAISQEEFATLNRDLKHSILYSNVPLPKNFVLKLPPGTKARFLARYASL